MISIQDIVADRERIEQALAKRVEGIDFTEVIGWHQHRKARKADADELRNRRKTLSAKIPAMMKSGEDASEVKERVKQIAAEVGEAEAAHAELDRKIHDFLVYLPNVPEDEVPAGGKENNQPLAHYRDKPAFDFAIRDHVELATGLGLIDYERGVKIGGRGKWLYWGDGALLEWGLINYFVDHHRKNGYTFVLPPHLLRLESGYVAGQFPKFQDDVFYVTSRAGGEELTHFLLPTAETALANLFVDEVIPEERLPLKMFGYTPCYRREAGSYRTAERGTIRGNQFNKVEIFAIARPQESEEVFQEIVGRATALVEGLGLHFRVTRLAAGDCSEGMAKTYDVEVWLPSIGDYKEVSSVSTAHTFQAIRGNVKYRDAATKKNRYVHTLNGSGLATSRLLPAILEQNQRADGSVAVPEVLRPWVGKAVFEPVS